MKIHCARSADGFIERLCRFVEVNYGCFLSSEYEVLAVVAGR